MGALLQGNIKRFLCVWMLSGRLVPSFAFCTKFPSCPGSWALAGTKCRSSPCKESLIPFQIWLWAMSRTTSSIASWQSLLVWLRAHVKCCQQQTGWFVYLLVNISLHFIWGSATESQNGWVWKWPLEDHLVQTCSNAGPPRADCPGSCPDAFCLSPRGKTL